MGGIMFRGFWGLKMVPQVPTVIDGYKKIVEKLIHESDLFAPTPSANNTKTVQRSIICTVLVLFAHGQDDIISICAWENDNTANSHATSNTRKYQEQRWQFQITSYGRLIRTACCTVCEQPVQKKR